MTDEIRQELMDVPRNYAAQHLQQSYHLLLDPKTRSLVANHLVRFMKPICQAAPCFTEDEKVRLIYEVLSKCLAYDHTEYPEGKGDMRYSYLGCISSGKAVCMGIAELFTMLGSAMGLKVRTVIGYGGDPAHEGGLHAWNQIWINDIPYWVDLTWDLSDNVTLRGGRFKFYLKSDAYMERNDHTWMKEQYASCSRDKPASEIPKIPKAAVALLCEEFKKMRRSLAAVI